MKSNSVVQTFQRYLPLAETPNLLECWDFCYERSIGCVGILKDWLSRTLSAVLDSDENALTLTRFDLERHAWSSEQCMIMLAEAREEENINTLTRSSTLLVMIGSNSRWRYAPPRICH